MTLQELDRLVGEYAKDKTLAPMLYNECFTIAFDRTSFDAWELPIDREAIAHEAALQALVTLPEKKDGAIFYFWLLGIIKEITAAAIQTQALIRLTSQAGLVH